LQLVAQLALSFLLVSFLLSRFLPNLPISELFIGGMLPNLLMVIVMMLTCSIISRRNYWSKIISCNPKRIVKSGLRVYFAFLAIIIVVYGIYTVAFLPTEAAVVTVGFCLLARILVTREIKIKNLPDIRMRSGQITSRLAPLIADLSSCNRYSHY
jgi:C4-dicarboxylate transporter DctM subunit